jgi:hypothetical protein
VAIEKVKTDDSFSTAGFDPCKLELRSEEDCFAFNPAEPFIAGMYMEIPEVPNSKRL